MITRDEYLKACEIVDEYYAQEEDPFITAMNEEALIDQCDFTYFSLNDNSGNPTLEIRDQDLEETINYMFEEILNKNKPNIVYLLLFDEEIVITEDQNLICIVLYNYETKCRGISKIHLHEYPSYESAYSVALMMKEENPLCYDFDLDDLLIE